MPLRSTHANIAEQKPCNLQAIVSDGNAVTGYLESKAHQGCHLQGIQKVLENGGICQGGVTYQGWGNRQSQESWGTDLGEGIVRGAGICQGWGTRLNQGS